MEESGARGDEYCGGRINWLIDCIDSSFLVLYGVYGVYGMYGVYGLYGMVWSVWSVWYGILWYGHTQPWADEVRLIVAWLSVSFTPLHMVRVQAIWKFVQFSC